VPIAIRWISRHGLDLELGNVLSHYRPHGRRVVDRWEQSPGVENLDVFDIKPGAGSVVAISTLEHVRWDAPEEWNPMGAIDALRHLVEVSDRLLVTVPLGHHPALDYYLLTGAAASRCSTLVRWHGGWVETAALKWAPYKATTDWAEAVWVGEWL
jgi:hypothetical protein